MLDVDFDNFRQERCIFPVISTFFFTALSGEQEEKKLSRYKNSLALFAMFHRNKQIVTDILFIYHTLNRYESNSTAEMFFKPHLLLDEYIFIPINRK